LAEYCDIRYETPPQDVKEPVQDEKAAVMQMDARTTDIGSMSQPRPELAGHLVLMNEDTGEVVGQISEVCLFLGGDKVMVPSDLVRRQTLATSTMNKV
jgi:hypothetical protein